VPWLAELHWGPVLLLAAVAAAVVPRRGALLFCAAYALAALGDQTRLQPEVVSLAFVMTACAYGERGAAVARWHLTTLWLWAGLHKALSLGWADGGAAAIARYLHAPGARGAVAWILPAVEIGLGVASVFAGAWPVVRWLAVALHVGILLTLSPLLGDWNSAVWAWNACLAVIAWVLFTPSDTAVPRVRVAAVVLAIYPALFFVGITDAYLAHNLYSTNNGPVYVCDRASRCGRARFDTSRVNVPLPPAPRLYRRWFDRDCTPGSTLLITGPRTRLTDPPSVTRHTCPRR
jgi:hypothetical protein